MIRAVCCAYLNPYGLRRLRDREGGAQVDGQGAGDCGAAAGLHSRNGHRDFRSYAVVQEDGSLLIKNKLVRLYGIYIPQKGQFCSVNPRPPFCGTRRGGSGLQDQGSSPVGK
ncbi:MAG: hypothetical protein U1E43_10375 [Rhodospirillales bacterium]